MRSCHLVGMKHHCELMIQTQSLEVIQHSADLGIETWPLAATHVHQLACTVLVDDGYQLLFSVTSLCIEIV